MARIYIEDIAAYNSGILHGVWIDLDTITSVAEINAEISRMLESSPIEGAEEYQISDHDNWGGIDPSHFNFDTLLEINEQFEEWSGTSVVAAVIDRGWAPESGDLQSAIEESYAGSVGPCQDKYDWAWEQMESEGLLDTLPEWVQGRMRQALVRAWYDSLEADNGVAKVYDDAGNTLFFWQ